MKQAGVEPDRRDCLARPYSSHVKRACPCFHNCHSFACSRHVPLPSFANQESHTPSPAQAARTAAQESLRFGVRRSLLTRLRLPIANRHLRRVMRQSGALFLLWATAVSAGAQSNPAGPHYIGSEVCARCHASIAASQHRTPMGETWQGSSTEWLPANFAARVTEPPDLRSILQSGPRRSTVPVDNVCSAASGNNSPGNSRDGRPQTWFGISVAH